jgi:hypothetical protein
MVLRMAERAASEFSRLHWSFERFLVTRRMFTTGIDISLSTTPRIGHNVWQIRLLRGAETITMFARMFRFEWLFIAPRANLLCLGTASQIPKAARMEKSSNVSSTLQRSDTDAREQ